MCSFTLDTSGESTDSFVKCILPGFSRNFSLVSLHFRPGVSRLSREWFHVRNVVRRNYCLVTRAAHFAAGRNRSRHCAQALEPVASSTALVAKVSDMASVSEGEAVEMIRENLRSLQSRLGYLRAAGVIRNTLRLARTSGPAPPTGQP
ncbi:hypothetical protein HPB48_018862 [Haemaphysalis longicornis]|uniref:Uncharacterized protein n=1 Tax=Haemaphysalis longicornis TaxID=44386 RepID=A0A9J6FT83_HAELO|nr:hypothetical protein HPB48_018862 [Haemaphysalis longicornis]